MNRSPILLLFVLAGISLSGYLLASYWLFRLGFPLDDAWIHQTYARNLASGGEWAFVSGQPSAGSTAPLWSGLITVGYFLRLGPYAWAYVVGWVMLAAMAVLGMNTFQVLCPSRARHAVWVGVFLIFEWHLVWAAASGMETLCFAFLVLLLLTSLVRGSRSWLVLGLLIGSSVWVRPDGITLIGPALLVILLVEPTWKERLLATSRLSLGVFSLFLPYLLFNRALSGAWWPNTFFAKQAEYAVYRQIPLRRRFISQVSLPLIGVGAILLPGFGLFVFRAFRRRAWRELAGVAWLLGYFLLYALRLPVTYQHGRYVIPGMPIYFLYSLAGLAAWSQPAASSRWKRVVGKSWLISTGLLLVIFWFMGARAYAWDVAVIESEMVSTARWVAENTEPEALIAAHDIGALGYFGDRQLLDLAGLVSPEVLPFIRDEAQLEVFLNANNADYLITFPGWYPYLVSRGFLVYKSMGAFSPSLGGENMSVYKWHSP